VNRVTEFAVRRRSVTLLLAAGLFLAGIYSWGILKQELLPDIQFPVITVIAPYPGAGASDVVDQVTKPIEQALSGIPRLERLQSTSANSVSLTVAQFSFGTDVKETRSTIEQALAGLSLPSGVSAQVSALDINAAPVIIAAVQGTGGTTLAEAGDIARTEIVPELQSLDGVATADLSGGLEQQVRIILDPAKMAAANVSLQQVAGVLGANNITLPSGTLASDDLRLPVSTTHRFDSTDEIANLVVGATSGGAPAASPGAVPAASPGAAQARPTPIRIGDLGSVSTVGIPTTGFSRLDGQEVVTVSVSKSSGANTVEVADAVQAKLGEIAARHPGRLAITTVSDLSLFITESRDGLVREGGLGAFFAVLVIFLFLGSLRSTIVAAMSIPLSVLAALALMLVAGVSVNIMTLGGLAVAIGRVVDDAIVVLENIYRHRARGDERLRAVLEGTREVSGAITASTATTVAVFLPLGFVGGIVSQFFLPFALTVTFALLASLLVALTVVPVLAYYLVDRVKIEVDETGEPKRSLWVRAYTPTIRFALRNRRTKWGVLLGATAMFVASLALVPFIPTQFINAGGEKIVSIYLAPPAGTATRAVLEQTKKAEAILMPLDGVERVASTIPGEGDTGLQSLSAAFTGRAANSAILTVRLAPEVDITEYSKRLTDALEPLSADGYGVQVSAISSFSSSGLNVIVSGPDAAEVASATEAIMGALAGNADLLNLKSDLAKGAPEVEVAVDPTKALLVGSTTAQIGAEVRTILVPTPLGRVQLAEGAALPMYIQVNPTAIASVEGLAQVPVGTTSRAPLGRVADVRQVDALGSITRIDGAPAASITAEITSKNTGAVSRDVQQTIDGLVAAGQIPPAVDVRLAGVTQQQNSAFGDLYASMAVAILLVYVMMVLTFNSLVTPFVILFSLPLATIGAFVALYVTGRPIGISALIGMLMLIGIVVTNAIVLLDWVERLRAQGETTTEALVEGGKTRVRPILMTALATILALVPLAAGLTEGSIIASELGTVVIGGLFSSTFLTLVVIPVLYSLVDGGKTGVGEWLAGRGRRGGVEAGPDAAAVAADGGS
jgi:hydrophobic/amphiphilic exporter-1 (mainly G- bacteria), HAE1 family